MPTIRIGSTQGKPLQRVYLVLLTFVVALSVHSQQLRSPNGNFRMDFSLAANGSPTYQLFYKGKEIIKPSRMGLELKKDSFSLVSGFVIADSARSSVTSSWSPVWGEMKQIANNYNELAITLSQPRARRKIVIRFRVFDDGLGFRYEFPTQENLVYLVIKEEKT